MWQSKNSSRDLLQTLPARCLGSRAWGTLALLHVAQFKSSQAADGNPDSQEFSAYLQAQFLSLPSVAGELLCSSLLYLTLALSLGSIL